MRDLGQMGEYIFSYWCAEAGLICNQSIVDKTGWDFVVEFPFGHDLTTSTVHKAAMECKVQVKATDKNHKKLSISLSNLRRLATAHTPAFILFIEFDGKSSAQRAYLVHVDEDIIVKTLKKIHEFNVKKESDKLHKKTMTINYSDKDILKELNGGKLKEGITKHIGNDMANYVKHKRHVLESSGYENGYMKASFKLKDEFMLEELMDVNLGLTEKATISEVSITEERFGILNKTPLLSADSCSMSIKNLTPTTKAIITLSADKFSPKITFPCEIFNPGLNRIIPPKFNKIRIAGSFFNFIFTPDLESTQYNLNFGNEVFIEINKFKKLLELLNPNKNHQQEIIVHIIVDDIIHASLHMKINNTNIDFSNEIELLDKAIEILREFEVTDKIEVNLEDIYNSHVQITELYDLINTPDLRIKLSLALDQEIKAKKKETVFIFTYPINIGKYAFAAILAVTGQAIMLDNQYTLEANGHRIDKFLRSDPYNKINEEILMEALKDTEEKYCKEYNTIIFCDNKTA